MTGFYDRNVGGPKGGGGTGDKRYYGGGGRREGDWKRKTRG